jgi:hypothetical protein
MRNVMPSMLKYREAIRLLWNQFLREDDTRGGGAISSDAVVDAWIDLRHRLFVTLVLRHTGNTAHASFLLAPKKFSLWSEPIPFLRVVPPSDVPAMISRTPGHSGYWDHAVTRLGADADLRFIDFFDFGQAGYRDFQYFHVAVASCERHPELAGHEALVEVQYADVYVDDPHSGT